MVRWIWTGAISVAVLGVLAIITGTGLGWLSALSTPGEVRTWLSPPTAVGMAVGGVLSQFGFDVTDATVGIARAVGTLATLIILAWLCLKPDGRSAVRGAALAFFVLVAFGPVLQPWYLLWSLPLFAASGLSRVELRIALVGTAGFTLFGLVTSSATQDSLVQVSDLFAVLIVAAVIVVLLAISPRERRLILGDSADRGLVPQDAAAKSRAWSVMVRGPDSAPDSAGEPGR